MALEYGIVRRFDPITQTIDVQLDGTNDDAICVGVPIIGASPAMGNVVVSGTRCVIARVGGDFACLGYGSPSGPQAEAQNEQRGDAPGDMRMGQPDVAMLLLNEQGLATLQAAPGTALMLHGPSRTANLIGENIAISTPTVNGAVTSDLLGNPQIELSIYNALGRVLEYMFNGSLGISNLTVDRFIENNIQIGGDPAEGGIPVVDSHITVHTPEGPLHINLLPGAGVQISYPGVVNLSAGQLNITCPVVTFNGAAPTPLNAVVLGSAVTPQPGSLLSSSPVGISTTLFAN